MSRLTTLIVLAVLLPRMAAAQCGPSVSGRFGGEVPAVTPLNATNLLVAHGSEVEIYTLANPSAPAVYSPRRRTGLNAPAVKLVMTQGSSRAYALLRNGDVQVLNINYSPLLSVTAVSTIPVGWGVDVLVDGTRLYVAREYEEQYPDPHVYTSIEVFDGATPSLIASIDPLTEQYGFDRLAKVGNVLWVGFHEMDSSILGVDGFNTTNPAAPVRVGTALTNAPLGTNTRVTAMTAIGSRLLVSYLHHEYPHNDEWLRAVDVSVAGNPAWQTPVDLNGEAGTMSSIGNQLRISIKDSGVGTWDTSNPAALTWLGAYFDTFPNVGQIFSVAGTDYWAAGRAGLMTMNTTNPGAVSARSAPIVPLPTGPSVVRQRGSTTVVLDHTLNAMRLYDYTLPEAQQLRSSLFLPLYSELVELADLSGGTVTLACVATQGDPSGDSITIYDVTNPAAPIMRSTIPQVGARLMSASGSRLYVYNDDNNFQIIELAQPAAPQIRSSTHFGGGFYDYTCMASWSNNAVALGTSPYGLWLIDTTNATAPFIASVWNPVTGYRVNSVAKGTNYLYVSATVGSTPTSIEDTRLESLSVTNLASPTLRYLDSTASGTGYPGAFSSLTYISSPAAKFLLGLREPDISFTSEPYLYNDLTFFELPPGFLTNEGVPFPVGTVPIPLGHGGLGVSADGSRVLVAANDAGLYQLAAPAMWAPGFGLRPFNQRPCFGSDTDLTAFASGNPVSVSYRWYRDGVAMSDGPTPWGTTISGASTSVLHFAGLHSQDAWIDRYNLHAYTCVASNSCGATTSPSASLTICYANCDCSTTPPILNVNDFICFQNRFAAGDPYANCDGSTQPPILNVNDFVCFQAQFAAGCY